MFYNGWWACRPFALIEETAFIIIYNCLYSRETQSTSQSCKITCPSFRRESLSIWVNFLSTHSFKDGSEQRAMSTSLSRWVKFEPTLETCLLRMVIWFMDFVRDYFRWWQFPGFLFWEFMAEEINNPRVGCVASLNWNFLGWSQSFEPKGKKGVKVFDGKYRIYIYG